MPPGVPASPRVEPPYFAVSIPKLVALTLCTLGIYELYVQFYNWKLIKARDGSNIRPFWRVFLAYFFVYSLFVRVNRDAQKAGVRGIPAGPLAAGWIIVSLLWKLPDPYWLVTFAAVLFFVPVQKAINRINEAAAPGHDPNDRFTDWQVAILVIGGLLLVLSVIGAFLPEEFD